MVNAKTSFMCIAGGTVDAITLSYNPIKFSLTDGIIIGFRASGANTSTTPTANADGTGAKTIVQKGGQALEPGTIPGANAVIILQYDLANDRFELVNNGVGNIEDDEFCFVAASRFLTKN